jgi:hypothetical protein
MIASPLPVFAVVLRLIRAATIAAIADLARWLLAERRDVDVAQRASAHRLRFQRTSVSARFGQVCFTGHRDGNRLGIQRIPGGAP